MSRDFANVTEMNATKDTEKERMEKECDEEISKLLPSKGNYLMRFINACWDDFLIILST